MRVAQKVTKSTSRNFHDIPMLKRGNQQAPVGQLNKCPEYRRKCNSNYILLIERLISGHFLQEFLIGAERSNLIV